jgi:type I restriction enzyme S subunit
MSMNVKEASSLILDKIDKSSWSSYRFDDIAKNISERVDPNNTDLTIYIGLEHLDSNAIHIKRHGTPDDVNGQKLKFYKGDIIFGRRRAYLRKAGIAETDGFCSAHALVLRANPEVISPKLFPFFMHSNSFMHKAVDISVGSLSPTINWGTLKSQEFLLPPKDVQMKLVSLFENLDIVRCKENSLTERLKDYVAVQARELLLGRFLNDVEIKYKNIQPIPKSWELKPLHELFEKISKKNKDIISSNVLTISAKYGLVNQEKYFNKSVASKDLSNYFLLNRGDFAYNKSYSDGYPAGAIKRLKSYEKGVVSPLYICLKAKCSPHHIMYYEYLFESGFLNQQILAVAKEGARNHGLLNVAIDDFLNVKVPVPNEDVTLKILKELSYLDATSKIHETQLDNSRRLQDSLVNKVF